MSDLLERLRVAPSGETDNERKERLRAVSRIEHDRAAAGLTAADVVPGTECSPWRGLARMAHARAVAGAVLDPLDRQALDRYPERPPL